MHPQVHMVYGYVCPDVADLLLAGAPDLLHVMKILLDRGPVGEGFQNLLHARMEVRAEEREPAVVLPHQHHTNHSAHRPIGREERLVGLGDVSTVERAGQLLPPLLAGGALGQAELVPTVLPRPAATTTLARAQRG